MKKIKFGWDYWNYSRQPEIREIIKKDFGGFSPDYTWQNDSDTLPLKEGKTIRKLIPGDMSLLKGGKWQDGFSGVVHRSPHEEGPRLLLTFDPILTG